MNALETTIQIGSKLEKETSKFSLLKDRVDKYHDLSNSMSTILTTFEQRLGKLEQTILPVYNETEHLQKRQQNLDSTLQCLETVLSHYDASQEVCNLIHLGPSEGNISAFLSSLDKLKRAKDYFLNNNSQSVELQNVTSLFNTGCDSLNNHYKSLLKKHSYPMKPVDLLDLIYIEEDSSNEDCSSIKQLSPNTREELNTVSFWLEQNLRHEYMDIYSEERSDVVFRSLQHLKDHQKSGSWGNEPLKPRHYGRVEPKKTTSARLQQIFEKKANKVFLRATQTIEQSTGFSLKKNSSHSDHLVTDDYIDGDQELDKYLVLLLGLQRLLVWERTLLNDIIPTSRHTDVFSKLAQCSIDMVVKDAEFEVSRQFLKHSNQEPEEKKVCHHGLFAESQQTVSIRSSLPFSKDLDWECRETSIIQRCVKHVTSQNLAILGYLSISIWCWLTVRSIICTLDAKINITNRVLRSIARKEWTSALGIFSALKRVILLQPDIDRTCDSSQKQQLSKVLSRLQQTGSKALEQFLEVVKADSGTNLVGMSTSTLSGYSNVPKDATVHELTSNTIWFIEHLFEHIDVIGGVLQHDQLYTNQLPAIATKKPLSSEERNKALLGVYIKKVLAELNLTIMNKCEQYSDTATKHLFRLNNIHYVLKSLQRSNLLDLVILAEPDCEKSYLDQINELKGSYQRSWAKLLGYISPLEDLPRPINGKIKDKERAVIKERFSNFNKDFEDSCKIQRGVSVPDVILREGLKRDNAECIIPKYNKFFEVYADVQFSKNPDKYVKYRPQDINAMLNNLFDDSVV